MSTVSSDIYYIGTTTNVSTINASRMDINTLSLSTLSCQILKTNQLSLSTNAYSIGISTLSTMNIYGRNITLGDSNSKVILKAVTDVSTVSVYYINAEIVRLNFGGLTTSGAGVTVLSGSSLSQPAGCLINANQNWHYYSPGGNAYMSTLNTSFLSTTDVSGVVSAYLSNVSVGSIQVTNFIAPTTLVGTTLSISQTSYTTANLNASTVNTNTFVNLATAYVWYTLSLLSNVSINSTLSVLGTMQIAGNTQNTSTVSCAYLSNLNTLSVNTMNISNRLNTNLLQFQISNGNITTYRTTGTTVTVQSGIPSCSTMVIGTTTLTSLPSYTTANVTSVLITNATINNNVTLASLINHTNANVNYISSINVQFINSTTGNNYVTATTTVGSTTATLGKTTAQNLYVSNILTFNNISVTNMSLNGTINYVNVLTISNASVSTLSGNTLTVSNLSIGGNVNTSVLYSNGGGISKSPLGTPNLYIATSLSTNNLVISGGLLATTNTTPFRIEKGNSTTDINGAATITFTKPFTTPQIMLTPNVNISTTINLQVISYTTTQFTVRSNLNSTTAYASAPFSWFTIGS